jgi:hypothetical protein
MILLILLISLTACTPDPNEVFIQGSWQYLDPHLQEIVGETYLETFWTFASGTYETSSCCFVRFQQYGSYNVLESEGDTLTLELFNIDGNFSSERVQIIVLIDREADTIKLTGGGELTRLNP